MKLKITFLASLLCILSWSCPVYQYRTLEKDSIIDGVPAKKGTYPIVSFDEPAGPHQPARHVEKFIGLKLSALYSIIGLSLPEDSQLSLSFTQVRDSRTGIYSYPFQLGGVTTSSAIEAWGIPVPTGGSFSFSYRTSKGRRTVYGLLPDRTVTLLGIPLKARSQYTASFNCEYDKCPSDSTALEQITYGTLAERTNIRGIELPAETLFQMDETSAYHISGSIDGSFWSAQPNSRAVILGLPVAANTQVVFYGQTNSPESVKLETPFEIHGVELEAGTVYFHANHEIEAGKLAADQIFSVRGESIPAKMGSAAWFYKNGQARQLILSIDTQIQGKRCLKDGGAQFDEAGLLLNCKANGGYLIPEYSYPWYDFNPFG